MPNSNLTIFNNKRLSCSELLKSLLIANKEPINRDIKASLLLLKGLLLRMINSHGTIVPFFLLFNLLEAFNYRGSKIAHDSQGSILRIAH